MRIFGMLYTHACLWLDKAVMLDAADRIERSSALVDNVLACEQWRWRVLCLKVPMFWQNDGHHKHKEKTYDYFTPVMFKNRHTGTFPVVFHACGNTRNPGNSMWQQIRDWCFDRESVPDPKTEVFVPCNRPDCIAEQLLVKNKQPHRVLGREIRAWKNYMKHQLLLCAARSSKYEYVMSMDGLDVAYRGVFSNCRRVLEKSGKQMLLCGDWIGVPNAKSPPWAREIERQGGGHHPYLNAGVWIAKRRFAIEFLQKAVADHKQYGNDHEQIAYHRLWDSATMAIDRQCEVFQTYLCGSELVNVGCPDTWLTGRQSARSRREQVLRRA
jgi:hypothetical protein